MKTGVLPIKSLFLDDLNVPRMKIKQSCNGLLLCCTTFLVNPSDQALKACHCEDYFFEHFMDYCSSDAGYIYFICNPTTGQFKRISLPILNFYNNKPNLCIVFDPLKSPCYLVIR